MIKPHTPSLFVIALFLIPYYTLAQSKYEVGINAGAYVYQGELTPMQLGAYNTLRAGFSLWGSKKISDKIALRANIAFGSLHGDDGRYNSPAWRQERNLKFSTPVKEFSLLAVWNVYTHKTRFTPYLFAGIGYSFIKVNRDYSGFNAAYFVNDKAATDGLAEDVARRTPGGLAVVPLGAGLRYALNDRFSLHAETNYRLLESDYLDGFSKVGNPSKNDHYQSTSFGLIYSFGKKKDVDCPAF